MIHEGFSPGAAPYPPLRLTSPYVSIRRPDGKYWSGSPQRGWVSGETRLPTLRLDQDPVISSTYRVSRLFRPYLYQLRFEDAPLSSQLVSGSYTLTAYDRGPTGQYSLGLADVSASITVNVAGGASSGATSMGTGSGPSGAYTKADVLNNRYLALLPSSLSRKG